ncbi:growth/differentiation factor 10b [Anarrhichthys ocellatus]|uniref:growth/differentiation factor 10b n=1 Tax=Anarrhichthys ocellatus TaxID=433405 RepID=UPI0012ED0965|nr:interferon gamma receptor 1 [Anarrhichthys ocellatus]
MLTSSKENNEHRDRLLNMDFVKFRSVFLSLVWSHAALAYVEPPTNVTLDCHNMNNVLRWSYKQLSPGLRFKISIGSTEANKGYPQEIWVKPPAPLQLDVSSLSDPKTDYLLDVTAVIGQNESDVAPSEGIDFSYFMDSPATKICNVDFPSVNVTSQHEGTVLFRFTHPSLVYLQKLPSSLTTKTRRKKSHLSVFYYDVVIINQTEHAFSCETSVCEEHISVDAAQTKHCLKMSGELEKISVQATQEYCLLPPEETPSYHIPLIIAGSVLAALLVFGFVFYMVYQKQTTPTTSLPTSVTFPTKLIQVISEAVHETFFVPEVGPTSPTPLLSAEEEELTTCVPPSTEPELRLPLGMLTEDEGVSDDVGVGTNKEPGYMAGNDLEEDEALYPSEVPTGYEKRPVFDTLAPDEVTEGYRG